MNAYLIAVFEYGIFGTWNVLFISPQMWWRLRRKRWKIAYSIFTVYQMLTRNKVQSKSLTIYCRLRIIKNSDNYWFKLTYQTIRIDMSWKEKGEESEEEGRTVDLSSLNQVNWVGEDGKVTRVGCARNYSPYSAYSLTGQLRKRLRRIKRAILRGYWVNKWFESERGISW